MDLNEAVAYHSEMYSYSKDTDNNYHRTLETTFLCTISGPSGVDPVEYQFLESSNIETSNEEVRAYRNRLENHSVETVFRESWYPNMAYSVNVYFECNGDLSRRVLEVHKPEKSEFFAFTHECGYEQTVPFLSGEYFEVSHVISSNEGLALGVGQIGMATAMRRLASIVEIKQVMYFTITADETIFMTNDISGAESKLAGQYSVETANLDTIRAGGLDYLTWGGTDGG